MLKLYVVLSAFSIACGSCYYGNSVVHDLDSRSDSYPCDPDDMACKMRSLARMQRIQEFRTNLLEKLDLGSAPNISTEDLPSQITIESLKKRYGIKEEEMTDQDELSKELIILAKQGCILVLT